MDIDVQYARILEPPAIYSYEPTKEYSLYNVNSATIKKHCGTIKNHVILGCTIDGHIMYIRNDLPKQVYDIVLRHEKAHVNGWVHHNIKLNQLLQDLERTYK